MSQPLVVALEKLLAGEITTAGSTLTPAQREALDRFARQTGAVRIQPAGRGVAYQVVHRPVLEEHLQSLRPHAAATLSKELPERARNIASLRSSKCGTDTHATHYLLLKAIGPDVRWSQGEGRALDLSAQTAIAGVAALAIQPDDAWRSDHPLWLVENQALFDRLDWLPPHATGSIAYYAGQLPAWLLAWLATPRCQQIILFPDYDGIGLANFSRLLEASQTPCEFWLMPGWQRKLQQYGNQQIWRDNHAQFEAALQRLPLETLAPEFAALCQALRTRGLALEQEVVWLD